VHLHTSITASSLTILTVSRCTSTTYHRISAARVVCAPSITHCPHIVVATPGRLNSLTYYSHHCPASSPTTLTVFTPYEHCIPSNFSRSGGLCALHHSPPPYRRRGHSWTTQFHYTLLPSLPSLQRCHTFGATLYKRYTPSSFSHYHPN
jgi:hypothetical protein